MHYNKSHHFPYNVVFVVNQFFQTLIALFQFRVFSISIHLDVWYTTKILHKSPKCASSMQSMKINNTEIRFLVRVSAMRKLIKFMDRECKLNTALMCRVKSEIELRILRRKITLRQLYRISAHAEERKRGERKK